MGEFGDRTDDDTEGGDRDSPVAELRPIDPSVEASILRSGPASDGCPYISIALFPIDDE